MKTSKLIKKLKEIKCVEGDVEAMLWPYRGHVMVVSISEISVVDIHGEKVVIILQ